MNVNEALEELKKGNNVRVVDDDPTIFYQHFRHDTVGRMIMTTSCCSDIISFWSPEDFVKTHDTLSFEWVVEDEG